LDGGFILAGDIGGDISFGEDVIYHGYGDVYLVKTDASGNPLWEKAFGEGYGDVGLSVQETYDGGYIISGWRGSFSDYDVYLIKTDSNGNALWEHTFGGWNDELGYSVQQTSGGGYIIAGRTGSNGGDVYLVKADVNGNMLWEKSIGGTAYDGGFSVQQVSGEGYIIAGYTESYGTGGNDVYLIKTDDNGNFVWERTFGGTSNDTGFSVQQTSEGGYIITGATQSYGSGDYDVYLIKTDANGNMQFQFAPSNVISSSITPQSDTSEGMRGIMPLPFK
jgi:hypothetical protein